MMDSSQHLLHSLIHAPLLVGDLPEAKVFERRLFGGATVESPQLNFNQKLGHLYEDALELLLRSSDQVELLACHRQVINADSLTLGELDFVLMDRIRQRSIHLELAVKFYLAVETAEGWQFPGPDPRDNWQSKLDRMRTHQLVLAQHPEARKQLRQDFGIEQIEAQQLIYGCLFYPMASDEEPLPSVVNPNCRKGRWLYAREWDVFFSEVDAVHLVPKALWPVEWTPETHEQLSIVSVAELQALASERCIMFCLQNSTIPIFLVPDEWRSSLGLV